MTTTRTATTRGDEKGVARKSYLESTRYERVCGFVAASIFSLIYYLAPAYVVGSIGLLLWRGVSVVSCVAIFPVVVTAILPDSASQAVGKRLLRTWFFQQIPKYFSYEEFAELSDDDIGSAMHCETPTRFLFVCHPHGIFPFTSTCAMLAALGAPSDAGPSTYRYSDTVNEDVVTAVATALRRVPILNFITGLFGVIDASAKSISKRLDADKSLVLYAGGIGELFLADPTVERVIISSRKGFVKLALRHPRCKLVPIYLFGNTTCLSALTSGPLAAFSRKLGVSLTLFWGRWGLPFPRPVKLVYARGRPIDLPHIPHPTQADIDKYHSIYCAALLTLFDTYKSRNPDYANKTLHLI